MKILTLKGSQWARGGKNGDSRLLNHKGCSCCLGVDLLSEAPELARDVTGLGSPMAVCDFAPKDYVHRWIEKDVNGNNGDASACMLLNDVPEGKTLEEYDPTSAFLYIRRELQKIVVRDDRHRVDLLRPYFRKRGIILRFRPDL